MHQSQQSITITIAGQDVTVRELSRSATPKAAILLQPVFRDMRASGEKSLKPILDNFPKIWSAVVAAHWTQWFELIALACGRNPDQIGLRACRLLNGTSCMAFSGK